MDIEGAEAEALEGARSILANRRPSLLIEVHGQDIEDRCHLFLEQFGYRPQIVDQKRRWLKERRGIAHNRWLIAAGEPSGHR